MNKYLTRVSQVYSSKNKLEKAIQDFLKINDRKLINEKDLSHFKDQVIQNIKFLNQEYNRCAAKNPSWFHSGVTSKTHDYSLSGIDCIAFYVYEIRGEYVVTKKEENDRAGN